MEPRATLQTALSERYRIEREIGAGGMATVYLARDLRHDRRVALKVLKPELGAVLGTDRFLSEIRVTANLQHPNLLPLFDSGEAEGLVFYTMPYVEGESLRARLDRERQLPVDEAIRIVSAIAGALDYAHRQGVIHRDLKPENILLQEGQPVVADFGIALAVSNAGGERVTQSGVSLGTPQYMSPEQATGDRAIDASSDQYSLAAVLYEMLTGEPPHMGGTPQAIIARLLTEQPRPIRTIRPSVPPHVEAAVLRALNKIPADRFPSAREFAAALAGADTFTPAATSKPVRRPLAMIAGAAVALAVIAGVFVMATRGKNAAVDPQTVALVVPDESDATTAALSAQLTDAITQGLSELTWVKPPVLVKSVAEAKARTAATVIAISIVPAQDSAQLQVRVLNESGLTLRPIPSMKVGRSESAAALQRAIDAPIVLAGFASNPNLGVVALPSGSLPTREAFRALISAISIFGAQDNLARIRATAALQRAIALDTGFAQAKLWLGVIYRWYSYPSRVAGGAAETARLMAEIEAARGQLTPYETLLADFARTSMGGAGDAGLATIRQIAALTPASRIAMTLPLMLLEMNRPREALARMDTNRITRLAGQDSSNTNLETRYWVEGGEVHHMLGEYREALVSYRHARTIQPNDITVIRGELHQLAALGQLAEVQKLLDALPSAAANDRLFSFAGDVYLSTGQELIAHGHPDEGKAVLERGVSWFRSHQDQVARDFDTALREVIILDAVGRRAEAIPLAMALSARDTSDSRSHGYLGRMYASLGDSVGVQRELAWLRSRPTMYLQGAPTYERAAITARLGREHWDEAVSLLEESLRQGQGFGIRRRLHFFSDWVPLKEYPAFKRVLEPRG